MYTDVKDLILNKENYVAFSNDFAFAFQTLSKWATILFRVIISNIKPNDDKFYTFYFSVFEFSEFLNLNKTSRSNLYHKAGEICNELINFKVCIKNEIMSVFSISEYRNGCFYTKFSDDVKYLFLNLSGRYLQYPLNLVFLFQNTYALRLFEIVWAQDGLFRHEQSYIELNISELRQALGCTNKYKGFDLFNRKLLNPAIEKINLCTNLNCFISDYIYDKNHRKVTGIKIEIHKKPSDPGQILL